MMLLSVGETSLHRLLPALVQPLRNLAQSIAVQSLPVKVIRVAFMPLVVFTIDVLVQMLAQTGRRHVKFSVQ